MGQATFLPAAEVYRSLRKKGVTIRKPVDCMIASVAMDYDICLLHVKISEVNLANFPRRG